MSMVPYMKGSGDTLVGADSFLLVTNDVHSHYIQLASYLLLL